jgi:hypothetical protein
MRATRLKRLLAAALLLAQGVVFAQPITEPSQLAAVYAREVDRRLALPAPDQALYAMLLDRALQGPSSCCRSTAAPTCRR